MRSDPPRIFEADRITNIFLEEVKVKFRHYQICGIGGAFFETVNGFLFDFVTLENISEEQAEQDIQNINQLLLEIINNDERIRPYLSEWPFKGRKSDVAITFRDPQTNKFRRAPMIAVMGISNGKLYKFYSCDETASLTSEEKYVEQTNKIPNT